MLRRRHLNDAPARQHDYELEPPDDIIAELQSTVVQSRQCGERTRGELLAELVVAARSLGQSGDVRAAIEVASLAVLVRMAAA